MPPTDRLASYWARGPDGWADAVGANQPDGSGVVADNVTLRPDGDFTLLARFRTPAFGVSHVGVLVAKDRYPDSREYALQFMGGKVAFRVWSQPGDRGEASVAWPDGLPPEADGVAVAWLAGGKLHLSVNGGPPVSAPFAGPGWAGPADLGLGRRAGNPPDPTTCTLTAAALWHRAVTADELGQLAAGWAPGAEPPPPPPPDDVPVEGPSTLVDSFNAASEMTTDIGYTSVLSVTAGSTVTFWFFAQLDGRPWDLRDGGRARLWLQGPDGAVKGPFPGEVQGEGDRGRYQGGADLLHLPGSWRCQWLLEKGGVSVRSPLRSFDVGESIVPVPPPA